jgi:hypothetical protein
LFCVHAEHTQASSLRSAAAFRGALGLDRACAQRLTEQLRDGR